ncbi:hypothetical protein MMC17_001069 [Xylographa soralifera]|nr:hypothetical protein [Xylographa soralifera]
MACPKASSEHTKVVRFEHGPDLAPPEILLPVASSNSAFDATKLFQQWTHAVDLYFEHDLKLSAKKHRQILRDLRLLVPPQHPETLLTPEIQKFTAALWFNLGQIQTLRGQEAVACEAFSLSVKTDEKSALAWFSLGNSYFKLGLFDKSVTSFAKCLEIFDEMDTKSIDVDLEVSLENAARINSEMGGGNALLDMSENHGAGNTVQEKHNPAGRIKKFVLGRVPSHLNMQLGDLHKAWKATKTLVSPGGEDKLIAVPTNVVHSPVQHKTIVNNNSYDAFFNVPVKGNTEEKELDMPGRGYHDALTEIASSSKQNEVVLSVKEQETAPTVEEKEVQSSTKSKKKKKSSSKRKGKGKMVEMKGEEKTIDPKVEDQMVDAEEKMKMIDEKAEDMDVEAKGTDNILTVKAIGKKVDVKGKGKMVDMKVDVKGKGKMVDEVVGDKTFDVNATENILSTKTIGRKVGVKGKGKKVDAKIDVKGKGKVVDTDWKEDKADVYGGGRAGPYFPKAPEQKLLQPAEKADVYGGGRTEPYFPKRPEQKLRQPAEVEMFNFDTLLGKEQTTPLWLTKHRAIEEHFDDYHCLLPARDIVLDDFYRHAKNAVINDIYLGTPKFDKDVPPLQESLKGVDDFYRKAFKETPDLDGEDEWYCSISDMFFGKPQNLDKLEEIEKIRLDDSHIPGNITTEEYQMEMRSFLGIDPPSFSDQPVPGLPINAQLAIHNRDRKSLTKTIHAIIKAKEAAKEPPIDYKVHVKVTESNLIYLGRKANEAPATASTNAPTESTAQSTHFGSTFTGTGTVLLTPATPATGSADGGPAISLTPADNGAVSRYSEPEFEIGLPGMRTSLPHQEAKKEGEEKQEIAYMPDGVTPLQKGTGDGVVVEGMGPGEMLYPTTFEGF